MNMFLFRVQSWAVLVGVAALAGCTTPTPQGEPAAPQRVPAPPQAPQRAPDSSPAVPPPAPPASPPKSQGAQRDLAEGIELYDSGDFAAAINKLGNSPDISAGGIDVQTAALKYLAFSFCVTRRPTQCRTQFERAFRLDPAFDLAPAERGHPLWGPVFERAKKAHQTAPK